MIEAKGRFSLKNTYLTSHFPLISILLFSISFSLYTQGFIVQKLNELGVYHGMTEVFSESGIKLTLLFLLMLLYFMIFAALKLIADTIVELSLLFFSKDQEGTELTKIRSGSWLYLIGGLLSLLFFQKIVVVALVLLVVTFSYFVYFVSKVSSSLSTIGLVGLIFFHVFFWFSFTLAIFYALIKLYNSFVASLPV